MIRHHLIAIRKFYHRIRQTEHIAMVLVALGIGLLGGLCAVGFRELIHLGNALAWGDGNYNLDLIRSLPWYWKVGVPALGGFIVGAITYYFAREAKGHGVPEVIEAVSLHGGRIRPRVVIAKMLASGICIASGGSVGREGPIVQIGSSLGSSVGQWLKIGEKRLRTLVGCGAAAGIAATFNAPVAGALFAVEIILGDFGVPQFSPIVISSVSATVVSQYFLGDFPAFKVPVYRLINPNELFIYAVLGLFAGLAALLLIRVLYGAEDLFDRIPGYPPLKTAVGGLIVGVIALKFPQIFGVGYETINIALSGEMVWSLLLMLVFIKIIAISMTIGSGGSGGVFAPSLFIGAMVGGAIGTVANIIWPGSVAGPGAYALVGMGAVVAAGTHAPITAILIIFELTNDYKIILPLMISCIIATLLATGLQKSSIYTLKLLRRGIDIHKGQSLDVLQSIKVSDVMRREIISVSPETRLVSLVSLFVEHPSNSIFVVDDSRHLMGMITLDQVRCIMTNTETLQGILIAQDMMIEHNFPVFHPEDSLAGVMKRLGSFSFVAPVLDNNRIVGGVWPADVIKRYNSELYRRDMASSVVSDISTDLHSADVPGLHDVSMAEILVCPSLDGKTIAELDIRKRFNTSIVVIKHRAHGKEEIIDKIPGADTVLHAGDILLVMGSRRNIGRLENELLDECL